MDSEVLVFHGRSEACALCRLAGGRGFPHRPRYHREATRQDGRRMFCRGMGLTPYLTINWQQPWGSSANVATIQRTDDWPIGLAQWLAFLERTDLTGAAQIRSEYREPLEEYAAEFWQWLEEVAAG